MFAVLKREFRSYFQNVIGWLFVAALMALFGLYFYVYNLRQGYPYLYYTLSAITIIFMIAVPILTMRSFAEDRKNKTDQLMLTARYRWQRLCSENIWQCLRCLPWILQFSV